ncbi:MAG: 3-deoxy-manno-octulosonate cytidylyltransferase [Candidatus Omnitrophica bacterium]|nr:3-deoxy-manno-octulosonate cytidylyltransferase [Candidatus Omnitrophota bacterium]
MKIIGIIPARFQSTRFAGKVLADLGGKPVVRHVWESAKRSKMLDDLVIAADDERIIKEAQGFDAKVVYTSPDQPSGTDRLAEVVNPMDVDIVINIQGDEPMVRPEMIDELARAILDEKNIKIATLAKKMDWTEEIRNPNTVKVVIDKNGFALYFSRSVIPYRRFETTPVFYKHLGLYAYTKDFLFEFVNLPKSNLEMTEGLEQLRALESGYRIKVVETKFDTIGIDTPEDLEKARQVMGLL